MHSTWDGRVALFAPIEMSLIKLLSVVDHRLEPVWTTLLPAAPVAL